MYIHVFTPMVIHVTALYMVIAHVHVHVTALGVLLIALPFCLFDLACFFLPSFFISH